MSGGFIIIPRNVSLFRVKITDIKCELKRPMRDASNFYVEGDFDMFRTFTTSKEKGSQQFPSWPKYEIMFIYQTEYPEMLIAKRFKLALNYTISSGAENGGDDAGGGFGRIVSGGCCGGQSSTEFVGEAEVDLMTIAAGPQSIVLTLWNGTIEAGRIFVRVEMEEISEMKAELKKLVYTEAKRGHRFASAPIFEISKKNREDTLTLRSKVYSGKGEKTDPAQTNKSPTTDVSKTKENEKASSEAEPEETGKEMKERKAADDESTDATSEKTIPSFPKDYIEKITPPDTDASSKRYAVDDCVHYFSTSLPNISESAGLVIDVCSSSICGTERRGSAFVEFYKYLWMIDEFRDPEGLRASARDAERQRDEADKAADKVETKLRNLLTTIKAKEDNEGIHTSTPELQEVSKLRQELREARAALKAATQNFEKCGKEAAGVAEQEPGYGWFKLLNRARKDDGTYSRDLTQIPVYAEDGGSNEIVGFITGECHFTFMPAFCQMRAGTTVDGVVCNGIMYQFATIEPPFKSKVHRLEVDQGNYA